MMEHFQPEITTQRAANAAKRTATVSARRAGFTLIEIMIALAIFAIMMSIVFVPLNLALKLFHISKTRSDVLSATQTTMDSMERELRKAIHVFPNEALPGVTDRAPYTANGANIAGHPYIEVAGSAFGACDTNTTNAKYVDNTSRIDFLLPDNFNTQTGIEQLEPLSPLQPSPYLVTYYARRQNATLASEPFENPILLFRALIPYREHNGSHVPVPPPLPPGVTATAHNANLSSVSTASSSSRYPDPVGPDCGANSADTNRGSYWLNQLQIIKEPNLEDLCFETTNFAPFGATASIPGSHTRMLPTGITLLARRAYDPLPDGTPNPLPDYTPDTTFHCADTNNDGKIDQVTITLVLSAFDDIGADRHGGQLNAQREALTHVISLPNVK